MKRYKLFGENAELFPIARLIMNQDIDALERMLNVEWEVNQEIAVTKYLAELPITLALIENKLDVLDYLISKSVNLNQKGSPAIVYAAHNCSADTIQKLIDAGARISLTDNVGNNAISSALTSERYDLLPFLVKLGLKVDSDRGHSFRTAVFRRQRQAVEFFIDHGIDPNLRAPDMVFPNNPTAVAVAAQNDDLDMVRYLVAHGADVRLTDKHGERPYLLALKNNNQEMQEFLKHLEPKEWHDEENSSVLLRSHKVPDELISFLREDGRRIELPNKNISFIEFHHITNVKEASWRRGLKRWKFLDLLAQVDNYEEQGFLVWLKKEKKLASIDYEHDEIRVLCSWPEFVSSPSKWIEQIFSN